MLKIYSAMDADAYLSSDGSCYTPYRITLDGRDTCAIENKLFIRNDDPRYFYTDIILSVVDKGGDIWADIAHEFSWKLSLGDRQPLPGEWIGITDGNTLSIVSMGSSTDAATYLYQSFWIRTQIPRGHMATAVKSVVFRLEGQEWLVDE